MEFLTLHELSRALNKPERQLRYLFKNLLKKNSLIEHQDFIRDEYTDDQHFIFKINPVRFVELTRLNPAPPSDGIGYQVGSNNINDGLQIDSKFANNINTKLPEIDTSVGNQKEIVDTSDTQKSTDTSMAQEFIMLLKDQLTKKDEQLAEKDAQLRSKDELLRQAQDNAKEKDNAQILALSEIIRLNKKLLPVRDDDDEESRINVHVRDSQSGNQMDTSGGKNAGNQGLDLDNNVGNHGYQRDPDKHRQQNF